MGREYSASTQAELDEMFRLINYNGFYPRVMEPEEVRRLKSDRSYHEEVFQDTLLSSVKSWLEWRRRSSRAPQLSCT